MNGLPTQLQWIFFNVILALLPIFLSAVAIRFFSTSTRWSQALMDGELFIFSSTMSATSIGVSVFDGAKLNFLGGIALCTLILVLIISTFLFGISQFLKIKGDTHPNQHFHVVSSVSCALVAVVCGYLLTSGGAR